MSSSTATEKIGISLSSIEVLESPSQWHSWYRDILDYIKLAGYYDLFTRNSTRPVQGNQTAEAYATKLELWEDKQVKAVAAILNRVGFNGREQTKDIQEASPLIDALKKRFRPSGVGVFQELCTSFENLKLSDFKDVDEYQAKFRKVRNQFSTLSSEIVFPECYIVQKFLLGLGPAYSNFQTSFNQNHKVLPADADGDQVAYQGISFNEVVSKVLDEEKRMKVAEGTTALLASTNPDVKAINVKFCTICNKPYHDKSTCWIAHPELKTERKRKQGQGAPTKNKRQQANKGEKGEKGKDEEGETEEVALMAYNHTSFTANNQSSQALLDLSGLWVIDSGCSQHISARREDFIELQEFTTPQTVGGIGGSRLRPPGQGKVRITCTVGGKKKPLVLTDVIYCPDIGVNLISTSQLFDKGARVVLERHGCEIKPPGSAPFTASRRGGLLLLDLWNQTTPSSQALAAYGISIKSVLADPDLLLWHERMGHLGEQNLRKLSKMTTGMDKTPEGSCTCEPCVQGRMKEKPHKGKIEPGEHPLDLLHMDVFGPLEVMGFDGSSYWVAVRCDKTQIIEAIPLKHKSEVFTVIRQFLAKHEDEQKRRFCRRIRCDQGGEFVSKEMKTWCADKGIHVEPSTTEQHEQNGAAESLQRVIMDVLSPLMRSSGIELRYWPEVLKTAVYILNRRPNTRLNMTPFEAWHERKPDLQHMRTLGSTAYALKPKRLRKKLVDDKAFKCRLIGYEGNSIYRLLTPSGTIIRSSNVHFQEKRPALEENLPPAKRLESTRNQDVGVSIPVARGGDNRPPADDEIELEPLDVPPSIETPQKVHTGPGEAPPAQSVHTGPEEAPARTSTRINKGHDSRPKLYFLTALLANAAEDTEPYEPRSLAEAKDDYIWDKWHKAMVDEYDSLIENGTWTLVDPPPGRRILRGKWVYKIKRGSNGEILRYKARWVVRGFEQEQGLDYNETFASVVKPMSYKALFALAAAHDLELEQMDVKTAFLYGDIEEEIYVEQPPEVGDKHSGKVCRLNKALYGLKQSPRVWYNTLAAFLKKSGFEPLSPDFSVFHHNGTFIAAYVDDLLIIGPSKEEIQKVKDALNEEFQMTDLGPCQYYLGLRVRRDRRNRTIYLSQQGYLERVLKDFDMWESKPVATPLDNSRLHTAEEGYECDPEDRKQFPWRQEIFVRPICSKARKPCPIRMEQLPVNSFQLNGVHWLYYQGRPESWNRWW
jgi:hypothetical protein